MFFQQVNQAAVVVAFDKYAGTVRQSEYSGFTGWPVLDDLCLLQSLFRLGDTFDHAFRSVAPDPAFSKNPPSELDNIPAGMQPGAILMRSDRRIIH